MPSPTTTTTTTTSTHYSFWCKALSCLGLLVAFIAFYSLSQSKSSAIADVQVKVEVHSEAATATEHDAVRGEDTGKLRVNKDSNGKEKEDKERTVRVLCYGDSLTTGMAPPSRQYCPYAHSLKAALEEENRHNSTTHTNYQVDHIGLPGWTTTQFVESVNKSSTGLQSDLISHPHTNIVILLGGTNDLFRLSRPDDDDGEDAAAKIILNNLLTLHEMALTATSASTTGEGGGAGQTIALGIPPFRGRQSRPTAVNIMEEVNHNLQKIATENERMTFVEFPIDYENGGTNWSMDGLHLSCKGYDVLGKSLAPIVLKILQRRQQLIH